MFLEVLSPSSKGCTQPQFCGGKQTLGLIRGDKQINIDVFNRSQRPSECDLTAEQQQGPQPDPPWPTLQVNTLRILAELSTYLFYFYFFYKLQKVCLNKEPR